MKTQWMYMGGFVATMVLAGAVHAGADPVTWDVDDDGVDYPNAHFDNIQSAVDASVDGDTVMVHAGTYTSTQPGHVVDMKGKAITLISSQGPEVTIIDGQSQRRGIACHSNEPYGTVIEGFTITNGSAVWFDYNQDEYTDWWESSGGGVYCDAGTHPAFIDCIVSGNLSNNYGGGVVGFDSGLSMDRCDVLGNDASYDGGGLWLVNYAGLTDNGNGTGGNGNGTGGNGNGTNHNGTFSFPYLADCLIAGNTSSNDGGGLAMYASDTTMDGCVISSNIANDVGGGFHIIDGSEPSLEACELRDNQASWRSAFYVSWGNGPYIINSVFCGHGPDATGTWTDGGGNCIAEYCVDGDEDGVLDECDDVVGDGIHEVPSEYATIDIAMAVARDGDTVVVGPGTYTGTGDRVIDMRGKVVTLRSSGGASVTILDGESARRGVIFSEGESGGTVLDGFTIRNGYGSDGGGLYVSAASPTIRNCIVESCTGYDDGGGAAFFNSNANVTNCQFNANVASGSGSRGGGVYVNGGAPVFVTCQFDANRAWGQYDYDGGGGVYFDSSDGVLDTCVVSNNEASVVGSYNEDYRGGGGVYCRSGSPQLLDCDVVGNTAHGYDSDCGGGGVLAYESNVTITGGTVRDNVIAEDSSSASGGGVYARSSSLTLTDCTISGNTANNSGGGVYAYSSTLTDCTISGNTSNNYGGGVYALYSSTLTGCTISGNTSNNGGGGVYASSSTLTDCTISGNTANNGGGVYAHSSTLTDCTISGNTANYGGGGGVYASSSTLTDCTISGNTANYGGGGGGVYADSLTLTGCTISDNTANNGNGGGVYGSFYTLTLTDCTISGNTANEYGGGVYCQDTLSLTGCRIDANHAGHSGGGLAVEYVYNSALTRTIIRNNTATDSGGGIFIKSSSYVDLASCAIIGNQAVRGGGMCFRNSHSSNTNSNSTSSNCIFAANEAGYGGGVYLSGSQLDVRDFAFLGNDGWLGGAIRLNESSLVLDGLYMDTNTSTTEGAAVANFDSYLALANAAFCNQSASDIEGPWSDDGGNILGGQCVDSTDCDGDGVPDVLMVQYGILDDCNANGVPDECDLLDPQQDQDGDGVLDSCGCPDFAGDDGVVDGDDLLVFLGQWGSDSGYDLTGDGHISVPDLLCFLEWWGPCPGG